MIFPPLRVGATPLQDPNLALTTDQGIVKMTEDLYHRVACGQYRPEPQQRTARTVSNVNFGFAPPLTMTKSSKATSHPWIEGHTVTYDITLKTICRPSGRQGPTGCEYTVWATSGATGSNPKDFTNPGQRLGRPQARPDRCVSVCHSGQSTMDLWNGF